tara:strand:+ start:9365 stop:10330 length:966 start_codon:yes stop_codon:yes gene_type:complete
MIVSKTPFRVTLAGGGTDLPSFYEDHGGLVLTMAIDKYMYVSIKKNIFDSYVRLCYLETEHVPSVNRLKHDRARTALKNNGILNGVEITSTADLPSRSGMGSSGSFLVGLLSSIAKIQDREISPQQVAEEACQIEINDLQEPVGKQDQYIAAFGGVKLLQIDREGKVLVKDRSELIDESLISHMNIYRLNQYRDASEVLEEQNNKRKKTQDTLSIIKSIGQASIKSLEKKDYHGYGKILDDYWSYKKTLSGKVSNKEIDRLYSKVKDKFGVVGGKVIGAGGGGFILLFREPSDKLDKFMRSVGMPKLEYGLSPEGVEVTSL